MIGLIALCHEDGSWDASDDELKHVLWAGSGRRCITNSTRWLTGDGVIAGKAASSQEVFNIGFRQSVLLGFNWGLVTRGALAYLPDGLREKLIETEDKRTGFQGSFNNRCL
ncbi:PREDICTED: yae1 domain-containing 1 [Prunus dulcis]|uniref:PREDICTED: yae1 domain-containing 1 n=1 Tax=Prunus dulcis TaxID=3755 RepID=A0A5E4G885_PRUDU|nr:PREDICTED: yae1 domain-containing 1 [Prunus dulcis]